MFEFVESVTFSTDAAVEFVGFSTDVFVDFGCVGLVAVLNPGIVEEKDLWVVVPLLAVAIVLLLFGVFL